MPELRFTLIGEGPTDDALVPIIVWLLEDPSLRLLPDVELTPRFVDWGQYPGVYVHSDRIVEVLQEFPSDLIFVHQDADGPSHTPRMQEIRDALTDAQQRTGELPPAVPVVPVREMEAWLLIDESSIRRVVRNPRGRARLDLPHIRAIEACQDLKATLRDACRVASEKPRRRWHEVDRIRPRTLADEMRDFSPLRPLPAFQAFEADVRRVIEEQGWPARLG